MERSQKCCMRSDPAVVELYYPCTHCCCPGEEADRWIYLRCAHQTKTSPHFSCFQFYSFSGICVIYSPSFPKLLPDLTHLFLFQVPRIYWELSTSRILLMEFMEGGQVNDRAYMERNGINVNEVVSQPSLNWACWAMQN